MWLGHEDPRLHILGTKDERTPAWPEFEVMTKLPPLTNALHPVCVQFKHQRPMVQICAIACNIKGLSVLTYLLFMILKIKCGYALQQNSPTGFQIETSMLREYLDRVDELQP